MYTYTIKPYYDHDGKQAGWAVLVSKELMGWAVTTYVYPTKAQELEIVEWLLSNQG